MLFFILYSYIYIGDKVLEHLDNYLNDNKFKIVLEESKLYIANYKRLISLEDEYISILINNKKISINGKNLSLVKILEKDLLIKGTINKIEVIDE